jgi:hypothetical protein
MQWQGDGPRDTAGRRKGPCPAVHIPSSSSDTQPALGSRAVAVPPARQPAGAGITLPRQDGYIRTEHHNEYSYNEADYSEQPAHAIQVAYATKHLRSHELRNQVSFLVP